MKIKKSEKYNDVTFENVKCGIPFTINGLFLMKIPKVILKNGETRNSVFLDNGNLCHIKTDLYVKVLENAVLNYD